MELDRLYLSPTRVTRWQKQLNSTVSLSYKLPSHSGSQAEVHEILKPFSVMVEPRLFEDLRALASELVAQSVKNTDSHSLQLVVHIDPHKVRLEIKGSPYGERAADAFCDRRLGLIDSLADRWRIDLEGGKTWVEIDRSVEYPG